MENFKAVAMALVLVPLIDATTMEELKIENAQLKEELVQLKDMFSKLQAQMETKVDTVDFAILQTKLNDTEELEARVTVLEESMADLENDMDNVESDNILQDERLNILEVEINDNENDIEELVDITTGLTTQVSRLEIDVSDLDQRIEDLESGGGANVTERVDSLEEVTSQLTDDVSSLQDNDVTQDERISSIEEDVTSLDQRVEDLESGGVGRCNITDYGDTAFLAALSDSVVSTENPLIFDWELINPGGHYNTTTGKYYVPYDGIYQFSVQLQSDDGSVLFFEIQVDDTEVDSHADILPHDDYRSTTILFELQAGQTVHVRERNGVLGDSTHLLSYFSGYMISAN